MHHTVSSYFYRDKLRVLKFQVLLFMWFQNLDGVSSIMVVHLILLGSSIKGSNILNRCMTWQNSWKIILEVMKFCCLQQVYPLLKPASSNSTSSYIFIVWISYLQFRSFEVLWMFFREGCHGWLWRCGS